MTTRAQIKEAFAAIAARLEIDAAELSELCRKAGRAGWSSPLDRLATVLLADSREPGARGPAAVDRIASGLYDDSPARQEDSNARLCAEIARRCPARGRWQDQYLPVDAPPRALRALARQLACQEAHRRFPGDTRSAESRRHRFVLKTCGPLRTSRAGGAV